MIDRLVRYIGLPLLLALTAMTAPPNPPPAAITSISRTGLRPGLSSIPITIYGTSAGGSAFVSGLNVAINGGVTVNSITSVTATTIALNISTTGNGPATLGTHTITVTNPDGQSTSAALLAIRSATPGDYDGDGTADLAVYRPASGDWVIQTSSSAFTSFTLGSLGGPNQTAVPGDYDGDGRFDYAVYDRTNGNWTVLKSSTNYTTSITGVLGGEGFVPVQADYDGDGKTDMAVYQPASGGWLILKSSTQTTTSVGWGGVGYKPISGHDFDGDGKADIGVYRFLNNTWYVLKSSTNNTDYLAQALGTPTSQLVPADYDGDGKADFAVYGVISTTATVMQSSAGYAPMSFGWGGPGYLGVPVDVDGDGKPDLGTYRPATGGYSFMKSTAGYASALTATAASMSDVPLTPTPQPFANDYRVEIDAPAPGASANQPFTVSGWAIGYPANTGTNVDAVQVLAYPLPSGAPIDMGTVTYGSSVSLVGSVYGAQYQPSGFSREIRGLSPGWYRFAVSAHIASTGAWTTPAETVTVSVGAHPDAAVTAPANGADLLQPFTMSGWAVDAAAATGTGVDVVQIWRRPASGADVLLGTATLGQSSPGASALYGSQFASAGFTYNVSGLSSGSQSLYARWHSTVANVYNSSALVTVNVDQVVATPAASPVAGTYVVPQTITLSTATSGAQIYYRLDGGTPSTSSPSVLYSGPITLSASAQLRAIAVKTNWLSSAVLSADYTLTVQAPAISRPSGSYPPGTTVTITSALATGPVIHYTTNGVDPTESGPVLPSRNLLAIGAYTLKAKAWMTGATPSAVASATYTLAADAVPAVTGGSISAAALRADGTAWGWGANTFGSVGDGTTAERRNPMSIGSGVAAVAAGGQHGLALLANGSVRGWGRNNAGQVGDGSTTDRSSPTAVSGLTDALAVDAGGSHSVAVRVGGDVVTWGSNGSGQL